MSRKEWREVGKQSLYFVLALAGMALLLRGMDLLVAALGLGMSSTAIGLGVGGASAPLPTPSVPKILLERPVTSSP